MKRTLLIVMALLSFLGFKTAVHAATIHKVAPTYWWAGMKIPSYRFYCTVTTSDHLM